MYRKGYFMSEQDEQAAKGKLLLEFEEAKHRYALLKIEAGRLAKSLEGLANSLKTTPEALTFDAGVLVKLNAEIGKVIADIKTTWKEAVNLRASVQSVGLGHLLKD
jgi:hypothetical protein